MDTITQTNGLKDTVSVLETNKEQLPTIHSDMLYTEEERLQGFYDLYHDEGFSVYSDYDLVDFGQPITLLSITEEI